MKILAAVPLPDDQMARLSAVGEALVAPSGFIPTRDDLLVALADVVAVATTAFARLDRQALDAAPRLRVISQCGVGLDNIDVVEATRRGIAVCNTPGLQDETVAEMAITLIFATLRHTVANDRHVRSGGWMRGQGPLGRNVAGKRLGLIGMGGIGRAVARKAHALGMEVVYTKRNRDAETEAKGVAYLSLPELLANVDIVSLHAPLTASTKGMIGAAQFAAMKPGAVLINTARGAIVDEDALVASLASGHLAAAGLDVSTVEPLPPDHPLCQAPNVVLQPHAGGATVETRRAMERMTVDNLLAVLEGRRPAAIADPQVLS